MDDADRATLLWNNELLATLIRRLAGAGVISEHGADALAEEVRAHAASKYPQLEEQFAFAAALLRVGIAEECQARRDQQ